MKLYFYGLLMLIRKFIFRKTTGESIRWFSSHMGVVYIKFAQILAMQNYGSLFTEEDRLALAKICDDCNPIKFKKIRKIIEKEYGSKIEEKFIWVDERPLGSASISQVHKGRLLNGKEVAIKIKRKDVTKRINKDIKQLKKIIHRFGWIFKFKNILGSNTTLDLFINWIKEETDFSKEKDNIIDFWQYSKKVNNYLEDSVKIKVPFVYKKLCTENIIVMEYIPYKTLNELPLTNENKTKIVRCINDYFRITFTALFRDNEVIFHGDPHSGNIYIDDAGNIGFLDMGLLFHLDKKDSIFIRELFLNAYNGNASKLADLILNNSKYTTFNYDQFLEDIELCAKEFKNIPVTTYFMNMIGVFTKYNIDPPHIIFNLAKCFVALYGLNNISDNDLITEELLFNQIAEYYVNRTFSDFKDVLSLGINLFPKFVKTTLEYGLEKGISSEINEISNLSNKIIKTVNNCGEIIGIIESKIQK